MEADFLFFSLPYLNTFLSSAILSTRMFKVFVEQPFNFVAYELFRGRFDRTV